MGQMKLDKYYSKHTGSATNIRANIRNIDGQTITDRQNIGQERYKGLYIQMVEPAVSCNIGHY